MKEFSQVLRELRNSKGISQESLGSAVNVSRSAIAKYENGLGLPSEDVIMALCHYFKVDKDYLFPKENSEQIIINKNIKIHNQKKKIIVITTFLSLVIIILFSIVANFIFPKNHYLVLEDTNMNINIENPNEYQKEIILFSYKGGYAYQRIEIHKIEFTNITNLYLLRVHNTYVNGYMASQNDNAGFKDSEYTNKAYMKISFDPSLNNIRTIASWHQKRSTTFQFSSQFTNSDNIKFNGEKNLFDGAFIEKKSNNVQFSYNSQISDLLFDREYNKILRKCTINNDYYSSNWEYKMLDEYSKKVSFRIYSSYLFEAMPSQIINFEVDTKMVNTNMSISQKKIFALSI